MSGAHSEYEARLAAHARRAALHEKARAAAWWGRMGASAALAIAVYALAERGLHPAWLALPIAGIAAFALAEDAAERRRDRARRASKLYDAGLARLDGRWDAPGPSGDGLAPASHPYAFDLDILGDRSLFSWLCTPGTRAGADTLGRWLLEPASPADIRARQAAVEELRSELDLREALAVAAGATWPRASGGESLEAWAEGAPFLPWPWLRLPLLGLAGAGVAGGVLWAAHVAGPTPLLVALATAAAVAAILRRRVAAATGELLHAARSIPDLARVAEVIERREFRSPLLRRLRDALAEPDRASRRLADLGKTGRRLLAMRMEAFAPIGYALAWPARHALALETWRARYGARVRTWLASIGEIEALCALATHAYEHPEDPFPEIVDEGAPIFEAEGLGHPLIPAARCVRNDVRLGAGTRKLLLLSGSNMSGKSTLLRAVGVNAVLALAGAPVRARRLRLSPVSVAASVRVHDSLADGESRFYAEITRLRDIVGAAGGNVPVLFLLDEILQGTNSHDRLLGAEGVLRGLVERGAMGICSTHDLTLTRIVDALGAAAENAHFRDTLRDGKLRFDYTLAPGVVQQSNALELMRAVGLRV